MADDEFTIELEAMDAEPIAYKIDRLKSYAARMFIECTGTIHPRAGSATVTFRAVEPPDVPRRVAMALKHALRTEGLRAVAHAKGAPHQ